MEPRFYYCISMAEISQVVRPRFSQLVAQLFVRLGCR